MSSIGSVLSSILGNNTPLCEKIPVLSPEEAEKLVNFFNQQQEEDYFFDTLNERRGLYKQEETGAKSSWKQCTVTFGEGWEVVKESLTASYKSCKGFQDIQSILHKALTVMAKKRGWVAQTRRMSIQFMQHQLVPGKRTKEISWHRDDSKQTLVILLDNPNDVQKGWKGGKFCFQKAGIKEPISVFAPEQGYGILFLNGGTHHKVTPITPHCKNPGEKMFSGSRTILTLHEYGIEKVFSSKKEEKNKKKIGFFSFLFWIFFQNFPCEMKPFSFQPKRGVKELLMDILRKMQKVFCKSSLLWFLRKSESK